MDGSVSIIQRKAGTWTLTVRRDGVVVHRTAGIETLAEARKRAQVWVEWCGYPLEPVQWSGYLDAAGGYHDGGTRLFAVAS
jgi:hypothetical protein